MFLEEVERKKKFALLSEDYFGKAPELKKVEDLIGTLKSKYVSSTAVNMTSTKEWKEIEATLASFFGVETFEWNIIPSFSWSAYTMPNSIKQMPNFNNLEEFEIVKTQTGVRFANPKGKHIHTSIYSILFNELTPGQIMSIELHEIGHNFHSFTTLYSKIGTVFQDIIAVSKFYRRWRRAVDALRWFYSKKDGLTPEDVEEISKIISYMIDLAEDALGIILAPTFGRTWVSRAFERFKSSLFGHYLTLAADAFKQIIGWATGSLLELAKMIYVDFFKTVGTIAEVWAKYSVGILLFSLQISIVTDSYNGEKFSDMFAVSYGYGKETYETEEYLAKLPTGFPWPLHYASRIPILNAWLYLIKKTIFSITPMNFVDPHPEGSFRKDLIEKKLEYELEKTSDSKRFKEIEEHLSKIRSSSSVSVSSAGVFGSFENLWTKVIDTVFSPISKIKNYIMSITVKQGGNIGQVSDEEIFDFSSKILKNYIVSPKGYGTTAKFDNLFSGGQRSAIDKLTKKINFLQDELNRLTNNPGDTGTPRRRNK